MPLEVLQKVQEELFSWHGCGSSVLEISHRSKEFISIYSKALEDLRELWNIPQTHHILFFQGGATLQFAGIPLNLSKQKQTANYLTTGSWSQKALGEAKKFMKV